MSFTASRLAVFNSAVEGWGRLVLSLTQRPEEKRWRTMKVDQGISNMSVCVCVKECVVETSEPHRVDTQKQRNQQEMHETTTDDY